MLVTGEISLYNHISNNNIEIRRYCREEGLSICEITRAASLNKKRISIIELIKKIIK